MLAGVEPLLRLDAAVDGPSLEASAVGENADTSGLAVRSARWEQYPARGAYLSRYRLDSAPTIIGGSPRRYS